MTTLHIASPEVAIEREPRRRPGAVWASRLGATAVFIAALIAGEILLSEFWSSVVIQTAATVCTVAGLHLLLHWSGQVSLGHMFFVGVGGFFTANFALEQGWSPPLAMVAGSVMAMLFSITIGLPALRIKGFSLAITTLAAAVAADKWLFKQDWLVGGSLGILIPERNFFGRSPVEPTEFMLPSVLVAAGAVLLTAWIGRSGLGHAVRLVAADEEVAKSYGIAVGFHRLSAFMYSGLLAGLGGSILVLELGRSSAEMFPAQKSIIFVSAVLLGGPGRVWGSVIAASMLVLVPQMLDWGHYNDLIGAVALVLAVRFAPAGINGAIEHLQARRRGHGHDHGSAEVAEPVGVET